MRLVIKIRPETKRSSLEQAENDSKKIIWRAELVFVAKNWEDLRLGVKS